GEPRRAGFPGAWAGRGLPGAGRAGGGRRRSDRLWRRLPGGLAARHRQWLGHAQERATGRGDGGDQDRPSRWAESSTVADGHCVPIPRGFQGGTLVIDNVKARGMKSRGVKLRAMAAAVVAVLVLGGCAQGLGGGTYSRTEARRAMTVQFGTIESVRGVQLEGTKTP